jgi:pimeloyl-ACP methyl ester carboxylesterase
MSVPISAGATLVMPWLPPGHTMVLPGRGEVFYRYHRHANPAAPTLLLLHGWTASADLQFFTAYEALAEHYSFVAIDHRGHGRGLRSPAKFDLVEVADDAALLVQSLGLAEVVTVGYSMGGPISLLLTQRHPQLVRALVVQATALEWRAKWYDASSGRRCTSWARCCVRACSRAGCAGAFAACWAPTTHSSSMCRGWRASSVATTRSAWCMRASR